MEYIWFQWFPYLSMTCFCFILQIMESAIILEGWNVQWIQNRNEEQKCLKLDKWFNTIFYTTSFSFFSINLPIYVYCTVEIFLNFQQLTGLNFSFLLSKSVIKIIDLLFQATDNYKYCLWNIWNALNFTFWNIKVHQDVLKQKKRW